MAHLDCCKVKLDTLEPNVYAGLSHVIVEIERGPYRIDPKDKRTLKEIAQRSTLGDPEDRERAKQDKGRYTKMQVKDD